MAENQENPTFEEALEHLEAIIHSMERGDTPLADLVTQFEEGSKLLKICREKLKEAEVKIEKLNLKTGQTEVFEMTGEES